MSKKHIFAFLSCFIFFIGGCKNTVVNDNSDCVISDTEPSEYSGIPLISSVDDGFDCSEIKIGSSPYALTGILCLPKGVENPPVVIMIQGSGQSDYNETIYKNTPFKDIAEGLAKQGVASIRYNKRYYQYPETAPKNITIEDEVLNDVYQAIDFAQQNKATENSKIFILGHSLGGKLVPYISHTISEVSGIISMAGTPRNLEDLILDQNIAAINALTDKTDIQKKAMKDEVEKYIKMVKDIKEGDPSLFLFNVPSSYWLSLRKINDITIYEKLDKPMLILQGDADFQVYTEIDYKAYQDIFAGKSNVSFILYNNLNHLFMQSAGKTDLTEYEKKGTVDEQVIADIAEWILQIERG
ncbi:MAG: alpha/beta hydrolase [Eubacteriales bacterium]|nr:alpha/beta hydrolase [Eubacteriales bacterium]MDD4421814.1 alpha/beta hydrolase [Eubacteriales bacterium]